MPAHTASCRPGGRVFIWQVALGGEGGAGPPAGQAGVLEGLDDGQVGVRQAGVLSHHRDVQHLPRQAARPVTLPATPPPGASLHAPFQGEAGTRCRPRCRVAEAAEEHLRQVVPPIREVRLPLRHVERLGLRQLEVVAHGVVRILVRHHQRHLHRRPRRASAPAALHHRSRTRFLPARQRAAAARHGGRTSPARWWPDLTCQMLLTSCMLSTCEGGTWQNSACAHRHDKVPSRQRRPPGTGPSSIPTPPPQDTGVAGRAGMRRPGAGGGGRRGGGLHQLGAHGFL